ncbi:hypothetical protein [Rhizobium sp. NZLR4b]|uniref:hypothetical protein n=1 Tax=Rhizobium sp. NZLR4b TaxID=2731102 RepID=UPI001C83F768|nr:hypothetical protein [Rhizobium sp. NZLR4b]MBX5164767.1 hypothetical protein [Rhizobium sp. NZLR4b]
MKDVDIHRLRDLYPRLWRHDLSTLPGGWTAIAERLLADLNEIQPSVPGEYGSPLFLLISFHGGFAVAFVSPNPELGTWNAEKSLALIEAVRRFNAATSAACEVCSGPSYIIVKETNGSHQQRLCQHCSDERLEKFEARSVQ